MTRPITKNGMRCKLYAAIRDSSENVAYMQDFIKTMRDISIKNLDDIELLID